MADKVEPKKNKVLSAEDILAAQDQTTKTVNVPEWGGDVIVKTMTGEEAATLADVKGTAAGITTIVSICCVNEKGERIFTPEDVVRLAKKSFRALQRVQEVALEINGLKDVVQALLRKV